MTRFEKHVYLDGDGGYKFHILQDGTPCVVQEHLPGADGHQLMTEVQAELESERMLIRMQVSHGDRSE
ncbi:hypothetical protein [Deinococcus kurensis]|uniref:hypothetical protein n=1 Tax=Deinococcus kurensis TaxID=2662757 RepID=UPI0012D2E847|nr:hypothetical protein [Deinococcus kurensis]